MSEQENQELIAYRINKALSTMEEAEFLIENRYWNTAINKMYYSCYYAVSALLASVKIYPKSHSGTRQMFGLHFIKSEIFNIEDSDLYVKLFNMRQDADYEDFVDYEETDVKPLLQPTKEFISSIQAALFSA